MSKHARLALALAAALAASGCATLVPATPQAQAGIPAAWPMPETTPAEVVPVVAGSSHVTAALPMADIGWRDFFADPRLEQVVALALDNNRDLRVAILNVERARAQYRIRRADRLPSIGAEAMMERVGGDIPVGETYTAGVGLAAFELDLFGRVRNLSEAALQQYLATEEAQRAAQLSLVAEVAGAWLALAADQEQLQLSQQALDTYLQTLDLTTRRLELGATSALEMEQVRTQVATARTDVERLKGQVARDRNALDLLAGTQLDASLLPAADARVAPVTGIAALPAGLDARVLLRRPDVMAAEHRLVAASADIGAARAAFFPSISLTGSIGSASDALSGLFDGGTRVWSFMPRINLPIFQGGRLKAAFGMAEADRDIALAQYEQAIQSGFREVADALVQADSLARQVAAQQDLVDAATRAESLAELRFEAGVDSYLTRLDAQRTLYAAQQALVATRLAQQANRVTLYRVLGGGWREDSAPLVQAPAG
ncbi:efflux transporter outer membrane subunit [Luteimonas sp. MC1750]|uniref:efflux transporter outer membrane subunit n=1 Tax=Luteimonas sp. MC1750 TaxID=2799326 RepID=UPI0018F089C9|nr:efflux transporter outer membrane subunit [Luteimonas sp. MC1750]MBJ6985010.1 efflux transporter outer membrane subunit [Luteimonas sp. MC1750]QQO05678.1 efflux transporter outer membrane subunit [Luteimonas sp. MC1750]